jgi:hypothetical protein
VSVLHANGPRLDAGERIQLRVNGGMRSPAGISGGAADRVPPGGGHV